MNIERGLKNCLILILVDHDKSWPKNLPQHQVTVILFRALYLDEALSDVESMGTKHF